MNSPAFINLKNVTRTYSQADRSVEVLRGINLLAKPGEFVSVTGPSGSGKSTLLQIIGGLEPSSSGSVEVNGNNLKNLSDKQLSIFRNQQVGFVFQFFYLQPFLSVAQNLQLPSMFGPAIHTSNQSPQELAKLVGLENRLEHFPKQLSGGEMQRCAVARALRNNPPLLLADEPTGNLDSHNADGIMRLFETIKQQFSTTIIMVTHDQALSTRADREIKLKDGRVT